MAGKAKQINNVSLRLICQTFSLSVNGYRYVSKRGSENDVITD
jgi:hypothetical protein